MALRDFTRGVWLRVGGREGARFPAASPSSLKWRGAVCEIEGDLKLMIVGVDQWWCAATGDARLLALRLPRRQARAMELVNRAGDHLASKRIIGTTKTLSPHEAADPAFDLRGLAKR